MVRHKNHGGAGPSESQDLANPWWERKPEQLALERAAMAEAFPNFLYEPAEGVPAWCGTLDTGRGRFRVTVIQRADHSLPRVVPGSPNLFRRKEGWTYRRSPHVYLNGDLCVARRTDWNPRIHDTTIVVAWTAHWLAAFTEWQIAGREWPCEGTDIDVA